MVKTKTPQFKETNLYRHYDKGGILLYVGISCNLFIRTEQHKQQAQWWHLVFYTTNESFPYRQQAEQAEKKAIVKEKPLYNTMLSNDPLLPGKKVECYYDWLGRPKRKITIVYPND